MRIYCMTATFGKLEHKTLELKPGLNILEAPNEWGKSTWCAFLLAMFYGLDTRAKATKTTLAEKQRYQPWSGSLMAGRIDLCWKGRDITIERTTTGRVPMGTFRAYETASGVAVPELTAANCGAVLLGVEQSVFRRAGFIRQSDMPVTQDEALRRRLNDLVTLGDETGDADRLAKELKELKNKIRYNRTGLLPQAEAERNALEYTIAEQDSLESHCRKLKQRLGETKGALRELENHRATLDCAAAEADALRVAEARDVRDRAEQKLSALDVACAKLPGREEARKKIRELQQFQSQWDDMQTQLQRIPQLPEPPEAPSPFRNGSPTQCKAQIEEDTRRYEQLRRKKPWLLFGLALIVLVLGIPLGIYKAFALMGGALGLGLLTLILGLWKKRKWSQEAAKLEEKYGSRNPALWQQQLSEYEQALERYQQLQQSCRGQEIDREARLDALEKQRQSLCGSQTPQKVLEIWQQVEKRWEQLDEGRRELLQAENHLRTLQSMAKSAPRPAMEDTLTYSPEDTARLIRDAQAEQQRLLNRLGQYRGRIEALGDKDTLHKKLEGLQQRIAELERFYKAAALGLQTLARAQQELQRRFAPRISKRAQELLHCMTAGKYDRLTLSEDLSLLAGAQQEDILREAIWRSDGTMDQMYLALRLAVAEELTPKAPLILDDAFVRFDDIRLKAALEILKKMSAQKQVILFTCQSREKEHVQ